ncbi:MAG: hypothetical protein JWO53_1082 [Chlamydiia bacterium]|nr:hypothetical protein [Chlamydiia bacterium]
MQPVDSNVSSARFNEWIQKGEKEGRISNNIAIFILKKFDTALSESKKENKLAPGVITNLFFKELETLQKSKEVSESLVTLLKEGSKAALLSPKAPISVNWIGSSPIYRRERYHSLL